MAEVIEIQEDSDMEDEGEAAEDDLDVRLSATQESHCREQSMVMIIFTCITIHVRHSTL